MWLKSWVIAEKPLKRSDEDAQMQMANLLAAARLGFVAVKSMRKSKWKNNRIYHLAEERL